MNTIKKMLAFMLALALVCSLAACSDSEGTKDPFGASKPATTENKPAQETTVAKTTDAPTTEAPATEAPETEAPETVATGEDTTGASAEPVGEGQFAAIGNPEVDSALVGTWTSTIDFDKIMEGSTEELAQLGEMGTALLDAMKGITMDVNFELRADGTATAGVDEESAKAAMEQMAPALVDAMIPMVISMSGKTEEDFKQELEKQGMTMESFKEQMLQEINPEDLVGSIQDSQTNGQWRFVDGKLYIVKDGETVDPDNYMSVEVSGDKMTMTEIHGENLDSEEMYKSLLPMEFTRQ